MPTYDFTYFSVAESEEEMLDDVTAVLQSNGVDGEVYQKVSLVISEAFTNALVHGNQRNRKKKIKIHIEINEDSITADILDEGKGGLERIRTKRPPELMAENGRGVDLIRHCASGVVFEESESGGLRVSISVERAQKANT